MAINPCREAGGENGTDVVIIGAGPAGLCLAAHLQQGRVPFRILERGNVGNSWRRMPPGLKLVSPWNTNWLSANDAGRHGRFQQLTRVEYLEYLRDYADANNLSVESHCPVTSVSATENRFSVETARGEIFCRMLVNATGYFSNPIRPRIRGAEATTIPQLHYADYRGLEQIRALMKGNGSVLIVGKRLSAGQCLLELHDAGFHPAVSHRAPIEFGCNDWVWPVVYRSFALLEAVKLRLVDHKASRLDVRMPGGRAKALIQSGTVPTYPAIDRFDRDVVIFSDGRELRPGLVLYATGFAAELRHLNSLNLRVCRETGVPLCRDMESVDVPNLFFLGLEMARTFQSRFLRGIRNDARLLARTIETRLAAVRLNPTELSMA